MQNKTLHGAPKKLETALLGVSDELLNNIQLSWGEAKAQRGGEISLQLDVSVRMERVK